MSFTGKLRPSQADVVAIAKRKLAEGHRQLHVVAPPGSGKTVLGLYLWAEYIRQPALVLSPNSAIQAQWAQRVELFDAPALPRLASTDSKAPGLLTSLTYQAVTLPRRGGQDADAEAVELWIETLIDKGQALDPAEAEVWIDDLRRHNRRYYDERLSGYRKAIRDEIALCGEALQTLHASALDTLGRLKRAGVGLIILDECHHLLGHWGRVLADAHHYFEQPIVIGLTATPPDTSGRRSADVLRYNDFFGPVDYEVPTPAVVKDGFLAPYRDLVQLVRPTPDELAFVARADDELHRLVEDLCRPITEQQNSKQPRCRESLSEWLQRILGERRLPTGPVSRWKAFAERDPSLAWAGPVFLKARRLPVPENVPDPGDISTVLNQDPGTGRLPMKVLVPVLDRYIRHRLRRSQNKHDHQLADEAIRRLRLLGTQITETGSQACASPIGRVMAYSRAKAQAIVPILRAECQALGEKTRAIVVSDFEKSSAVSAEISHLLDEEAGGAVAAFRVLLSHEVTDALDPVLVTGSTVLVDDDLAPHFDAAAARWLRQSGFQVELEFHEEDGFHVVGGHGSDWCPRVYVAMVTELFQQGVTRCLVGTRGLLGEGWDASKVNVLIDLTTVTTSTSVNQLRGRSLRLDRDDPGKLAHNWDVICIAPEFTKGLDDYDRFVEKHNTLFGLADDGLVEKGVGHVHAAFTEIKPELVEESMGVLNTEMLQLPRHRSAFRARWRIGEPFHPEPVHALEISSGNATASFPTHANADADWKTESLTRAIGHAVYGALQEAGLITATGNVQIECRSGDYVRAFLQTANREESRLFSESLAEALGPLDRPRYVIRRHVDHSVDTWLSRLLPDVVGKYFQRTEQRMVMLHAVPVAMAKNKGLATIYGRHWNEHVSPGQPVSVRSREGAELVDRAKRTRLTPHVRLHNKEVFV